MFNFSNWILLVVLIFGNTWTSFNSRLEISIFISWTKKTPEIKRDAFAPLSHVNCWTVGDRKLRACSIRNENKIGLLSETKMYEQLKSGVRLRI